MPVGNVAKAGSGTLPFWVLTVVVIVFYMTFPLDGLILRSRSFLVALLMAGIKLPSAKQERIPG